VSAPIRVYDHISPVSYFRLLFPDLLPVELNRVIYLDCDLVVLGDIGMLWNICIEDEYAAAVPELAEDSRRVSSSQGLRLWRELGLAADLEQFNSGVLLINLEKWRAEFIQQRTLVYLEQAADWLRWHDQEALNAVFAGGWLRLDAGWNLTMRHLMKTLPVTYQQPCIIHYHSAAKPWHAEYPFALQEVFLDYLDRTAWTGWRPVRTRFGRLRHFGKQVVKALHKRQHTLRRLRNDSARRLQSRRLLAARPTLQGNPLPENTGSGEVRIFMHADDCSHLTRTLIEQYLARGGDRIILAIHARVVDAWRAFAASNVRVHLVEMRDRSGDEILRVMLHHYGQGHWCLLTRSDEWLRFPYDDRLTLTELTQFLDAQHCTALMSRRVELLDAKSSVGEESSADSRKRCGEFWLLQEAVHKLPMTEHDMIRNRIFVADSYVVPSQLGSTPHAAYRSAVTLLRYKPDMLIGPGARSAQGTRVSDIEGVMLQAPERGQVDGPRQSDALSRIGWRELEAVGLLRATDALERIARDAPPTVHFSTLS
jgi:lipopolysaccharide biosynthesis glycosyltransferase